METLEELLITFDPSRDEVLGVFDNKVHVRTIIFHDNDTEEDVVLVIPKAEYLRVWSNWLDGKQRYCELWGEYCGVMGYTFAYDFEEDPRKVTLNDYVETSDVDNPEFKKTECRVFTVYRFDDDHDFEHG